MIIRFFIIQQHQYGVQAQTIAAIYLCLVYVQMQTSNVPMAIYGVYIPNEPEFVDKSQQMYLHVLLILSINVKMYRIIPIKQKYMHSTGQNHPRVLEIHVKSGTGDAATCSRRTAPRREVSHSLCSSLMFESENFQDSLLKFHSGNIADVLSMADGSSLTFSHYNCTAIAHWNHLKPTNSASYSLSSVVCNVKLPTGIPDPVQMQTHH